MSALTTESMKEPSSDLIKYEEGDFDRIGGKRGELGEGGFGSVFLASHRGIGNVAIKCFQVTGGSAEKERIALEFQNELDLLQQANHEHILRVHGWTEWPGYVALVLEYMPGGNLSSLLQDPRIELSPVLRHRLCFEIATALAFIHNLRKNKCLSHGDIKPENVLLSKDLHCKLGDFGSAKVGKRSGSTTTGGTGKDNFNFALTRVYAAPERLERASKPKKEHDTYSFGLVVHMVLTGEVPYEDYTDVLQYLEAVKKGDRPLTDTIDDLKESLESDRDRKIIETLESLMKSCWDQTPSLRPKMADVRDDLQGLLIEISDTETLESVAAAVNKMKPFIPCKSSKRVSLRSFKVEDIGSSSEGSEQTSAGQDGVKHATAISVSKIPQEEADQPSNSEVSQGQPLNSEIVVNISQNETSSTEDVVQLAVQASDLSASPQKVEQQTKSKSVVSIGGEKEMTTTQSAQLNSQHPNKSSVNSSRTEIQRTNEIPGKAKQPPRPPPPVLSKAKTSLTTNDSPPGKENKRESKVVATKSESAISSRPEKGKQRAKAPQPNITIAKSALTSTKSPAEKNKKRDSQVVAARSDSTVALAQEEMKPRRRTPQLVIPIAKTSSKSKHSPPEKEKQREPEVVAAALDCAISSTQERNKAPSKTKVSRHVSIAKKKPNFRAPSIGDRVVSLHENWAYYQATVVDFNKEKMSYIVNWDDNYSIGRVQSYEDVVLDSSTAGEIGVNSIVFFSQGSYGYHSRSSYQQGLRFHKGRVTKIYEDNWGDRRFDGEHMKNERDGKYVNYRGYSPTFRGLKREDLRFCPNDADALQACKIQFGLLPQQLHKNVFSNLNASDSQPQAGAFPAKSFKRVYEPWEEIPVESVQRDSRTQGSPESSAMSEIEMRWPNLFRRILNETR